MPSYVIFMRCQSFKDARLVWFCCHVLFDGLIFNFKNHYSELGSCLENY